MVDVVVGLGLHVLMGRYKARGQLIPASTAPACLPSRRHVKSPQLSPLMTSQRAP